jgi:hypothetical protein
VLKSNKNETVDFKEENKYLSYKIFWY